MEERQKRVAPEDRRCSHIYEDGRQCPSYRAKRDAAGRCAGHAGLNGDLVAAGRKGNAAQSDLRRRRRLLGLKRSDPRLLARVTMLERAEEVARAIVDAPLDDPRMSTSERQKAVLAGHAFAFDEKLEVERPVSTSEVEALRWKAVEKLAQVILEQAAADGSGDLVHEVLEQQQAGQAERASLASERGVQPRLGDRAVAQLPATSG